MLVKDENHNESVVRLLEEGSLFGEVALIANGKRTATIRCMNYCTCAALSNASFKEICKHFPETFHKMKENRKLYDDKWKQFLRQLVSSVPFFRELSENTLEELLYGLEQEFHEKDAVLFKPGDVCTGIRYLSDGEIDFVVRLDNGEEILIDTLFRGCVFG